jgi:hypothetical protein
MTRRPTAISAGALVVFTARTPGPRASTDMPPPGAGRRLRARPNA